MWTLINIETDIRWWCGCPCLMRTLISSVTDSTWCRGCPCYTWTLIFSKTDIADDVVALVIYWHWFPVGLIAFVPWLPSIYVGSNFYWDSEWLIIWLHLLYVTTDFQWGWYSWFCGYPCYIWTLISSENESHWPVVAHGILGHWFPTWQSHWYCQCPCYMRTQISSETGRRCSVIAIVICEQWFPVWPLAIEMSFNLLYVNTDFQCDW